MALILIGCWASSAFSQSTKPTTARSDVGTVLSKPMKAAIVEVESPVGGDRVVVRLDQGDARLATLANLLPHIGAGKASKAAGGWMLGVRLRIDFSDGSRTTVNIDENFRVWSEGRGDHRLDPAFKAFIDEQILRPDRTTPAR